MFYQDFAFTGRTLPVEEVTATPSEYIGAGVRQTFELNPFQQLGRLGELRSLQPSEDIPDTVVQDNVTPPGLAPDDPRARRMTLDEANEAGKAEGLRFSDPPTKGQFDYLLDMKRSENERAQTLSKAPGVGTQALGLVADFAASAIDPINIASAFIPIVPAARHAAFVKSMGTGRARLTTGAIEGGVGTALVEPLIYTQAQALQQNFTLGDAFMDVAFGTGLGAGLHWGGGFVGDRYKAYRKAQDIRAFETSFDSYNAWRRTYTTDTGDVIDWRALKVTPGETPHIIEAMKPEDRAKVLNSAVKAVENDRVPRVDELLKTTPSARPVALPADPKYPATLRLGGGFRASDFTPDSRAGEILSQHLHSAVMGADSPDPKIAHESLLKAAQKRYKGLKDWTIWTRPEEAYRAEAPRDMLEFPEQQVYVDAEAKTIVASEGASLGAVHHEIQRALDNVQGYRGETAGGYRYHRGDQDGPLAHRRALEELAKADPSRGATPEARPEQAVDLFAKAEPIFKPDEGAARAANDRVQDGKDKDLDTLMREEEIEVLEDTARHLQNSARANAIFEKVIPVEERDLFDMEAVAGAAKALNSKVEQAVQESVDKDYSDQALLNQVRSAYEADPEIIRRWLADEITDDEFDELAGKPLPEKTPEEGEESLTPDPKEGESEEDALIAEMAEQVQSMLDKMSPADAANLEATVIAKEQQTLSGNRQVKDLFRVEEHEEFNAANSERASRQGQGAAEESGRAAARQQPAGTPLEDGLFQTRTGGDGPSDRGAGVTIERERSTGGSDRSPVETAQSIGWGAVPKRVITPDGSLEVGVEPVIVEYDSLRKAEGKFQPRDRTRKESDANIMARASNLDPEQLMPTRVSDSGPPIVTADGMVISGNGRYMTIGTVYRYGDTMASQALRYRERLGAAADGFKRPILVMRITDDMSEQDLVKFADRSNRGRIEQMSATEKAQRDVQAAGMDLMQLYQGGDFERRENRQFLQSFMRRVVTTTELGEISKNGRLTKEGYDRLNAAVLAAAYDDTGVLSLMLESADDNIRSITSAYRDVAPRFMQLRAEIGAGVVKQDMDLTPYLMQAARIISEQREKGVKISAFLAQQDAFDPLDPVLETLIRAYYNADLTRAASAVRIAEFLGHFVDEARLHQEGGFIPDDTRVSEVLDVAKRKQQGLPSDEQDPTGLLGPAGGSGQSAPEVRQAAPQQAPEPARREAGAGGERGAVPEGIGKVQLRVTSPAGAEYKQIEIVEGDATVGTITLREKDDGKTLHIMMIQGVDNSNIRLETINRNAKNMFGTAKMRSIFGELRRLFPSAEKAEGFRATGARENAGAKATTSISLLPRKVDLEPSLPVRADNPPPTDTRVKKLNELKERGKPEDMDAYLKTLEKLKKDDLLGVAEQYVGGKLAAKDKRSKATIIAAIKVGVPTEKAPPKGDGSLTVPLKDLAGMGVMQLRKVAKDSMLVLNQAQKKGDIIALFHKTFNADGSRKVAQTGSEVALLPPERVSEVAPAPAEREPDLLGQEPLGLNDPAVRQAAWVMSGSKERLQHFVSLTNEKLHLIKSPEEKEIVREATFAVEDALDFLDRGKLDDAVEKVVEALAIGKTLNSRQSQIWMQEIRQVARNHGIDMDAIKPKEAPQAAPDRPRADEAVSLSSLYTRDGEEAARARMEAMDEADLDQVLARQMLNGDGQATKAGKIELAIAIIKDRNAGRFAAAGGSGGGLLGEPTAPKEVVTDEFGNVHDPENVDVEVGEMKWPESMSAKPTRRREVAVEKKVAPKLPLKGFYDYLEGPNVVKSARWMAKQLNTTVENALKLLDHGVDNGWLKLKDDGTYIRVPKKDRPVRPGTVGDLMIDDEPTGLRTRLREKAEEISRQIMAYQQERIDLRKERIQLEKRLERDSEAGIQTLGRNQIIARIQQIEEKRAELYAKAEALRPEKNKLTEKWVNMPRGDWAIGWDQPLDIDLPKTAAEWIGHTESLAILHLAAREDTSPRSIQDAYGYTNRSDYVRLAHSKGFEVPSAYSNAVMERELQAQLIGAKVLREATRILPEAIRVSVNQDLSEFGPRVGGVSHKDFIRIAKNWDEGKAIDFIHHEAVHSLRRMRMFTAYEWKLVEREALGNESWLPAGRREVYVRRYNEEIASRGLDDIGEAEINTRLLEEAFAWGYGNWAASRKAPETMTERLWDRIRTFFDRLFFNAKKFFRAATAEDVMKAIYRGDIGQRWSEWNGGRVDDNARNSLRTFALDDMVKDMNARMREMAFDDSEKMGNIAVRSLEALIPCAAYHL